jgi:hypothetical protein
VRVDHGRQPVEEAPRAGGAQVVADRQAQLVRDVDQGR